MQQLEENGHLPPALVFENSSTVLVFDSGVGGLTVYEEIRKRLPNLNCIYAFDNGGFPYGEKEDRVIINRVVEFISCVCAQQKVDYIVIACNTASTIVLPVLRALFSIPVIGVVPAIKPAVLASRNKVIGLLATRATINRSYTHKLIEEFAKDCEVKLLGLSELAMMAEQRLQQQKIDCYFLKELFHPWLSSPSIPDTIVLGCTHYPFLKEELSMIFPLGTTLIDSGEAIARRLDSLLAEDGRMVNQIKSRPEKTCAQYAYYTSYNQQIEGYRAILNNYGFNRLQQITLPEKRVIS